jgi:type I restriction enzyme S subunit
VGLPECWDQTELSTAVARIYGGGTPSTKAPELWAGNLPWITSKKLGSSLYLESGEKLISEQALQRIATRVGVGKVGITKVDLAINQDLAALIVDKVRIDPEFLAYQLMSDGSQRDILVHKRGATIQGITRDSLKRILIVVPPLPEQ